MDEFEIRKILSDCDVPKDIIDDSIDEILADDSDEDSGVRIKRAASNLEDANRRLEFRVGIRKIG